MKEQHEKASNTLRIIHHRYSAAPCPDRSLLCLLIALMWLLSGDQKPNWQRKFRPIGSDHEGEMSYTAILRLKPRAGEALGTWKPSKAFEAPSEREAIKAAFDWKDKNTAEGYKAKELWLSEGSCKTMLWQAEDVERIPVEKA